MVKLFLVCLISIFANTSVSAQNNFVNDSLLDRKLRNYLISRSSNVIIDKDSQVIPLEMVYSNENILITSRNLKTDGTFNEEHGVGVYGFKFASLNEKPYLYFQYKNRIEFIELDNHFNLQRVVKRILKFLKNHCTQFTLEERLKSIENTMEVIYFNKYPPN